MKPTGILLALVVLYAAPAVNGDWTSPLPWNCKDNPLPKICPNIYEPVCGTNDKDYKNICELERASVKSGFPFSIRLAYTGPCWCDCRYCPRCYKPVCGTDKKTYWNICWLRCYNDCNYRRKQPKILPKYPGYC